MFLEYIPVRMCLCITHVIKKKSKEWGKIILRQLTKLFLEQMKINKRWEGAFPRGGVEAETFRIGVP